jgi:hypothetical protein
MRSLAPRLYVHEEKEKRLMSRLTRLEWLILASVVLVPAIASAQGSIAGVVRDTSGAVLPGVTVEAFSPVLIEKVRSVVTDEADKLKIVDLRPGTSRWCSR